MSNYHTHPCTDCGMYAACHDGYHADLANWRCPECRVKAQQIPANPQEIENARAEVLRALRPLPGYRRSEMAAGVLKDVAHIAQYPDTSIAEHGVMAFAKAHGIAQALRVVADALEVQAEHPR